jgi:hypothetical protein
MLARLLPLFFLLSCLPLWPQAEYRVYNEHPRIWLDESRLLRVQRDAERNTPRWARLKELLAQPGQLQEPAFAEALAYQAAGDEAFGRAAVDWALGAAERNFSEAGDLRQGSLVFDWCQPLLNEEQRAKIAGGLAAAITSEANASEPNLLRMRDALLASIAVSGAWPGAEEATGKLLNQHWKATLVPQMEAGKAADRAVELQAALEICVAVRHNLDRDLWSESPQVFRDVAMTRILSYLPDDIETKEGRVHRPSVAPMGSGPETEAIVGRVAEMTLVGYDSRSRSSQFLQGWLRSDAHTLRGGYGAPYEFLWLNPYLPGLSPTSGPQSAYDPTRGRFFARSGWGADGLWLGFFDGKLLRYEGGTLTPVEPDNGAEAISFPGFAIALPEENAKFQAKVLEGNPVYGQYVYLLGMDDQRRYEIKIGDNPWHEYHSRGGVIQLTNEPDLGLAEIDFHEDLTIRVRPSKH